MAEKNPKCFGESSQFCSNLVAQGLMPEKTLEYVGKMTYKEARRHRFAIYNVLLMELYEEGCLIAAKYFSYLIEKETRLKRQNLINATLKDQYPKLMIHLLETVKLAEKVSNEDTDIGGVTCLKLLYDSLSLLESYEYDLSWLLDDAYCIFVDLTETILNWRCNLRCTPIMAKLFCRFGIYLMKKVTDRNTAAAIHYFRKALDVCRGELWSADDLTDDINMTIHDFTAVQLSQALMAYARSAETPKMKMFYTRKALAAITEINIQRHAKLFAEIMLEKIQYFMDAKDLSSAMSCILFLQKHLHTEKHSDYILLTCELFLKKGTVYKLMRDNCKALMKFKQCRLLSYKYALYDMCGRALLKMGQVYEAYSSQQELASQCYEEADKHFRKTHNEQMRKISKYAVARVQTNYLFPKLLRTLKAVKTDRCALLRLYYWKTLLLPLQPQKHNMAYFLAYDDMPECPLIHYEMEDDMDKVFKCEDIPVKEDELENPSREVTPCDSLIEYAAKYVIMKRDIDHGLRKR